MWVESLETVRRRNRSLEKWNSYENVNRNIFFKYKPEDPMSY